MSEYKVIEISISSKEEIIQGLLGLGFSREMIEVHQEAENLYGYRNDKRNNKANIIVRRQNVNRVLRSGASNDIGFEYKDGKWNSHISKYDQRFWKENQFKQGVAEYKVEKKAKNMGYRIQKQKLDNGSIKLICVKSI